MAVAAGRKGSPTARPKKGLTTKRSVSVAPDYKMQNLDGFFAVIVFLHRTWAAREEDWPQHGAEHSFGAQGEVLGQRREEEARAAAAGAGNGDFLRGKNEGKQRKFKTPAKVHH